MKTIFLKTRFKGIPLHSLYNDIIRNPPEQYSVTTYENSTVNPFAHSARKSRNKILKALFYNFGGVPYILAQTIKPIKGFEEYDLIFASQHVINSNQPWIVDFEFANALSGYASISWGKKIISKKLEAKSCKFILPFSDWASDTLRKSFDCKNINEKIRVLRPTVAPKSIANIKKDQSKIQILFVGSANPSNIYDFEFKGLNETVDAFIDLQKKYDNLELVIRSKVSEEVRKKTSGFSNIRIIERILNSTELEELYVSSDISPHAGFSNLNATIFEAMSYGIPVIATSLYNIPELIKNMKNGMLIELPKSEIFYTENGCPNDYSLSSTKNMKSLRMYVTEKLKEAISLLIEDKSLRQRLGKAAVKAFEEGEFSMKTRQKIIREVFDNATTR